MGFIRPLWLALVLGANILLILFNSVMLGVTGTDKIWWDSKDELDNQIETYKRKCIAYERAREDLIQVQLKYHYDNASEEYDVTLKKLKD